MTDCTPEALTPNPTPPGLIPWVKGQSGNPKGKKKGTQNRDTILRKFLEMPLTSRGLPKDLKDLAGEMPKGSTVADAMNAAAIKQALKGEMTAFKEIQDSLHGKLKEVQQIIPPDITKADIANMTDEEVQAAYESRIKG